MSVVKHPFLGIQRPAIGKGCWLLELQEFEHTPDPLDDGTWQDTRVRKRLRVGLEPGVVSKVVESIAEAETAVVAFLLERAPRHHTTLTKAREQNGTALYCLNAAASISASRNRRGVARDVMVHPRSGQALVDLIEHPQVTTVHEVPVFVGSFTFGATNSGRDFRFYESTLIPEGIALLTYRGNAESDVMAAYVEEFDQTYLSMNTLPWGIENYATIVEF